MQALRTRVILPAGTIRPGGKPDAQLQPADRSVAGQLPAYNDTAGSAGSIDRSAMARWAGTVQLADRFPHDCPVPELRLLRAPGGRGNFPRSTLHFHPEKGFIGLTYARTVHGF